LQYQQLINFNNTIKDGGNIKSIKKADVKPETRARVSRFARVLSKAEGEVYIKETKARIDYSEINIRIEKIKEVNND
jgi:transposase-like protein